MYFFDFCCYIEYIKLKGSPLNYVFGIEGLALFQGNKIIMNETNLDELENIERRQNFRIDMERELVNISWHDSDGQAHKLQCSCEDFSKGGLRIEHDFAIAIDTVVEFKFQADHPESRFLPAKVVRCIELQNGKFSLGFQMA